MLIKNSCDNFFLRTNQLCIIKQKWKKCFYIMQESENRFNEFFGKN